MIRQVPPVDPSTGEQVSIEFDDWETATSRHFILHSDAGLGAIQTTLRRFEETYQALKSTFFEAVEVSTVEALLFGDPSEYVAVAGSNSVGKFLPGVGATGSLLVLRHSESDQLLDTLAHELAHRFLTAAHPGLPHWLQEGVASYLESVDVRGDEVRFGAASQRSVHGFGVAGGVSFETLIRVAPAELYGNEAPAYYAAAWALVNFLMSGRAGALRARFGALLVAVEEATRRGQNAEAAFAGVYPDLPVTELDEAITRLTRSLSRPAVDLLLSMPFQRLPDAPFRRQEADQSHVRGLVAAVQRRRPRSSESAMDLGERPRVIRLDVQTSLERLAYVGVAFGRMFRPPFAWELDFGLGPLGYQAAALARGHLAVGEGGNFFLTAALGPMVGVKSERLGNEIAGATGSNTSVYYLLAINPELGAEVRTPSNIVVRVGAGAYLRLAQNFTERCIAPSRASETSRCPADPADARIARAGHDLFFRLGLGYSW